jgi:hydroxyacylglutathione hydrolase
MFLKRFRRTGLAHGSSELVRITEEELKRSSDSGAAVVDLRLGIDFAEGHFPGSLNIGLAGRTFTACVGLFLSKQKQIFLVVDKSEEASIAQAELAGAGFDKVLGFIEAGDLTELHRLTELSAADLKSTLSRGGKPAILDVRSPGEWRLNRIPGSGNIPLAQVAARMSELSFRNPLVVVCQDGYQSLAASSWLQANGFDSIQHLLGGMEAYISEPFNDYVESVSVWPLQADSAGFSS